jgi:hypothetical protein
MPSPQLAPAILVCTRFIRATSGTYKSPTGRYAASGRWKSQGQESQWSESYQVLSANVHYAAGELALCTAGFGPEAEVEARANMSLESGPAINP